MVLTRAQREALKRVYDRIVGDQQNSLAAAPDAMHCDRSIPTYREFRRTVQQGWDCIMVPYAGMWLGIETDGYTHS